MDDTYIGDTAFLDEPDSSSDEELVDEETGPESDFSYLIDDFPGGLCIFFMLFKGWVLLFWPF